MRIESGDGSSRHRRMTFTDYVNFWGGKERSASDTIRWKLYSGPAEGEYALQLT